MCATPRSGSTLLCEMLRATGVAGKPLEHFEVLRHSGLPRQPREYFFDGEVDRAVLNLLAPLEPPRPDGESPEAWRERILRAGVTPNGAWGGKLMWGHVGDLLARLRAFDGLADAGLATALRELLGDVRFVLVTREDKVAQAVSLWRAVQTDRWRADAPGHAREAVYSFAAVDHLVAQLEQHEAAWRAWFARGGAPSAPPLELTYEGIGADPRAAVARVLRFAGLPNADPGNPSLSAQGDAVSREWVERYLREKRAAAA